MKDPKFKPQADFVKKATFPSLARYKAMHRESITQPDKFWGRLGPSRRGPSGLRP